jgi:hypothetical protein
MAIYSINANHAKPLNRHPPDAGLADTENHNSPSKAPLAEDCWPCAILAVHVPVS